MFSNYPREIFDLVQYWLLISKIGERMILSQKSNLHEKRWNLLVDFWGYMYSYVNMRMPQFQIKEQMIGHCLTASSYLVPVNPSDEISNP